MKIKRFTNEGRKEWSNLYKEIFISIDKMTPNRRSAKEGIVKGYNKDLQKKVEFLKKDKLFSEDVPNAGNLEIKDYKNSYDLGCAIDLALKDIPYKDLFNDLNLWDIASGIIIIKEAGGMINEIDLSQNKNIKIRASSMAINDKMLEKLKNF